ncbi:DctP family TRAP transporter solute-binding subunit [Microbacterium sp. 22242]|uniref:DctP family TRAP transporter solute-binding subunit n=1 Tax=Microbacterium sp. 22242 TaxID=3453896 RepID=UPI003F87E85A
MKRRLTGIAAGIALALTASVLAGCSSGAHGSTVTVKLSIPDPITSSVGMAAQHFADAVGKESHGAVKVTVIPNGTSFGGDQTAAVTRVQNGSLDGVILSTSVYAASDKRMNAISLPYLFSSTDQEVQYLKGEPGKSLLADLDGMKTKGLALLSRTPRVVTNNVRPITSVADFKGLKIRVPGNPLWTTFFAKVGASPTPMAFSEVYTALQTGAIDGQENPVEVPASNKFAEVQKYISMTNHMSDAFILALSDKKWNALDKAAQKAVQAAADDTATYKTKNDASLADKQLSQLEAAGMKKNDLPASAVTQLKGIARSLYPSFAGDVGGQEFLTKTVDFVDAHQ